MKDKNNKTIKVGDKIAYKYPTSESWDVVVEKDGILGINDYWSGFVPLADTDLENAEIQE